MFTLLKSFSVIYRAITVIIMVATDSAPSDRWNRGNTHTGATNRANSHSSTPRQAPHRAARVFRVRPVLYTWSVRPAPISLPMMMAAVAAMPKENTMQIFSTLPAMV